MIDETTMIEPEFVKSLTYGYCLVKYDYIEPMFQIRIGSGTSRDVLHQFDNIDDTARFIVEHAYCADLKTAYKLLNKGGHHD